jgi:N-acetyl-alpha-D-muramate 1-phosphate uridylyltransferase
MKAMILAAGRGERMRPLTDSVPKPLLKANDTYLILLNILNLHKAGVTDLVVNVAHLAMQIVQALGDGSQHGVRIRYSHEQQALETAGGIAWALPLLDDQPFLVVNSDVYCEYDFAALAARAGALTAARPAHLVLVDNPDHHPQGDFALHDNIVSNDGVKLTFSGIGAYHPALFANIPRGAKARLAAQLSQPIAEGQVSGEHFRGIWVDVGTPQRLAQLDARLRQRGSRTLRTIINGP